MCLDNPTTTSRRTEERAILPTIRPGSNTRFKIMHIGSFLYPPRTSLSAKANYHDIPKRNTIELKRPNTKYETSSLT